jgi:LuxR family maltose regulon positive regulatory protein
MAAPILATKFFAPPVRQKTVLRPRLFARLNEGVAAGRKVTLISAPAGFGKTTLLSEWAHQKNKRARIKDKTNAARHPSSTILPPSKIAWLSLDEADNDLVRFLKYVVAALQTIAPNLGAGAQAALQSPQPPPVHALVTALLNEIAALPNHFILVLDDYHVIDAKPIDDTLAFMLEHLPPQMHLVIATREDPDIPLALLRARDQLVELRAADLRFTQTEAADFINRVMGLDLLAHDIAALETRTEGWIAGLQLAALALQGYLVQSRPDAIQAMQPRRNQDIAGFVQHFAGSHRYVLDYLVGQVLERRSESERSFLLQTSILDRLCGPLCEAVTEQENGGETLETFERRNLFVIPLDDQRRWYRYHHLFAQVLQARLMEQQPEQVPLLHRRAAAWYERNNLPSDAIRHALAATDFEHAAELIELQLRAMHLGGMEATWLGWVKQLPDELVRARPVLNVYYAFGQLPTDTDAAGVRLDQAEQLLNNASLHMTAQEKQQPQTDAIKKIVANQAELRSLPGTISIARAYRAGALGDVDGIVQSARRALDLLPENDHLWRGAAAALLGIAYWNSGDLDAAHQAITDGVRDLHRAGGLNFSISAKYLLADIRLGQGRLTDAKRAAEQSLRQVAEHGSPVPQGTADLHVVLSEAHLERNALQLAEQHLETYKELGPFAALVEPQHRWYCAKARLQEARGDLDGALEFLDEGERQFVGGPTLDARPIAALRAAVWLKQGRLREALAWANARGLGIDNELTFAREFEHITFARILIAQSETARSSDSFDAAMKLLERLLQAAAEQARLRSIIEILVLRALAYYARNEMSVALAALQNALALAEPEGYVRIFVDEGAAMAELLRKLRAREVTLQAKKYIHTLREAFENPQQVTKQTPGIVSPSAMLEPLSERERDVLAFLKTELSGPEIARALSVSLNTVRTHTKNIYSKLEVNNRRAAVRRAQELDLL